MARVPTDLSRSLGSRRLFGAGVNWLTSGWSLVTRIAMSITLLLFLFQLPFFFQPGLPKAGVNLLEHLYVIIWLLAVTAFNRTLPLRILAVFWFVGIYPVTALALLAAVPLARVYGAEAPVVIAVWVPFTEELMKALPVVLFLALAAHRKRWQPSATDALLLGLVIGAAYAFHEDAMAMRNLGSGWVASVWSIFFPTLQYQGSVYQSSDTTLGHAGWTALVSLALGLAFLYRRYRWAWLLPLFVFGLVTLSHGLHNYLTTLGRHAPSPLLDGLYGLLLRGQLVVAVLLIGIAITVVLEQRMLRRVAAWDPLFLGISPRDLMSRFWPITHANLPGLQAASDYVRLRRAAYYAVESRRGGNVKSEVYADMPVTLFKQGVMAGLPLDQKLADIRAASAVPEASEPAVAPAAV